MWALVKALIAFCIEFLCLFLIEHPETEWLEEVKKLDNWLIVSCIGSCTILLFKSTLIEI